MATHLKEFLTDRRILFLLSVLTFYCISTLFSTDFNGVWIAAVIGIIWFYLVEYIVHRFILHGYFAKWMPKAYKGHDMHHENPNDIEYLLTPNIYNISYHIGFGATVFLVTQNFHLACAFMLGITFYQLYYEWSHFVTHRSIRPLTPWGRWMKKFHLLHHFKSSNHYFGVTNPSIDMIVGTYPSPVTPAKPNEEN
ncbi:sterol desaturase family protein [Paenibacillus psychroresistens]|uniref:sterol desaturase family protein n=1 Tax=Paenibacillus psychroresistens TaxID=1778678 RepID=UPI001390A95D|nr:sterol desaturase family protein [Paenibacillus psychroresistens]